MATIKVPDRGKWVHVIKLENPAKGQDSAGCGVGQYQPFATCRGRMDKQSGFRNMEEGYDQLVSEWWGFIPWRNAFEAYIRKDTRIIYDNRVFKMVRKERVEEQRMTLWLTLIEVE